MTAADGIDRPTALATLDDLAPEVGIPPETTATLQPPALASAFEILDVVARELAASGVAGESRTVELLYLAVTSRLLERPCSVVVKGPSAGGKSFVVEQVLALFPPDAYYALSAMSERALAYDREPLVHRMLVLYEAAGISGEIASYLMRSLLSEGRINYVTVVKTKNGLEHKHIVREGPTGLITTTTAVALHPENETRLLSLTVTDSAAQTRAIMLAQALGTRRERDRASWYELQGWLAATRSAVEVPMRRRWPARSRQWRSACDGTSRRSSPSSGRTRYCISCGGSVTQTAGCWPTSTTTRRSANSSPTSSLTRPSTRCPPRSARPWRPCEPSPTSATRSTRACR